MVTITFNTCFNCPSTAPTLDTPKPDIAALNGSAGFYYPLSNNCDTKWWGPIGCLCTSTECQYKDTVVPINCTGDGYCVAANGSGSSNGADSIMHSQWENALYIVTAVATSLLF